MFGSGTASQTFTQGFTAIVLNTDVQAKLIHDEDVKRRIEPSAAQVAAATAAATAQFPNGADNKPVFPHFDPWFQAEYKLRSAEQAVLGSALGPAAKDPVQIQAFYDLNPLNFITTECVSHILVASQGEAATDPRPHRGRRRFRGPGQASTRPTPAARPKAARSAATRPVASSPTSSRSPTPSPSTS